MKVDGLIEFYTGLMEIQVFERVYNSQIQGCMDFQRRFTGGS